MNKYTETKDMIKLDRKIRYKGPKKIWGILSEE
jgi:hypothetical protein